MALQGQLTLIYLLMQYNLRNCLKTENKHLNPQMVKSLLGKESKGGLLAPWFLTGHWGPFLCRVSFPVWLASLAEALARLFLQFPFSPFLQASFLLWGGAGGLGDSVLGRIVPVYGPADPTSLLLNTLAHNGGSVTPAPNLLLPFPPKQETGIYRALVFLLISCFAAPSPDYCLFFFAGSCQFGYTKSSYCSCFYSLS